MSTMVSRRVMWLRLATGLAQSVLLFWLHEANKGRAWPANEPYLAVPLFFIAMLLPVLLVSSLGHMTRRRAVAWMAVALLAMVALSVHDVWRGAGAARQMVNGQETLQFAPSFLLIAFGWAFFYIAQSLVLAGASEGRLVARYSTYFETAWKLVIQLKFSVMFAAAMWAVLLLGSLLFKLVKLDFLGHLMDQPWFALPVTCCAFAWAMHITDVRPAIVRGIRTLLLVLMSWILPLTALLITVFLCCMPFTGMNTLWQTGHATALLLAADAVLLVLINAAFQHGGAPEGVAAPVRGSARLASLLLLPLTAIAIHALALRVGDYGWSTDRVIAAACLLVASCYALGYAWAACRLGSWLALIAPVNVFAAFLVLAVVFSLFTPLADPARLSVNDQLARLERGRITAAKLDYRFLRFEGGRYGKAALEQLAQRSTGPEAALLREKAAAVLKETERWGSRPEDAPVAAPLTPAAIAANVKVWPAGAALPADFLATPWSKVDFERPTMQGCLTHAGVGCELTMLDVDGDGKQEILLFGETDMVPILFARQPTGGWAILGRLPGLGGCVALRDKLRTGSFKLVPPRVLDLEVGGQRIMVDRDARVSNWNVCGGIK
ncbi:DUF4153 domain-containing protein [Oxalobacteraceae bacterium]|nr:DUF4153 domain-containing protein [Oxalobacteraceae bacterium]